MQSMWTCFPCGCCSNTTKKETPTLRGNIGDEKVIVCGDALQINVVLLPIVNLASDGEWEEAFQCCGERGTAGSEQKRTWHFHSVGSNTVCTKFLALLQTRTRYMAN
jgi:hypothetical protein